MSKKFVLIGSSISLLPIIIIKTVPTELYQPLGLIPYTEFIFNVSLLFPFIFIFALLTYWLPSQYFSAWWCFARITIPIIFAISVLINLRLHHSPGGFMNLDNIFDVPAHFLMYGIFVLGSLWQLGKVWRERRRRQ